MKEVRPTTSKIIQAFFNILGNLDSCSFLDLFSGTGRVAWEARAHGASIVTVESVHERARQIHEKLGDLDHLCLCMDVRRALPWLQKKGLSFDVIFADPPYQLGWMCSLPVLLADHRSLLKGKGTVVLERSVEEPLVLTSTPWTLSDERRYGISILDFLRLKEDSDSV